MNGQDPFRDGLRCRDLHSGLRNVDPNSSAVVPLADTRIVGMAADLAALVRGQDIISDAESLKAIVAEQLDIAPYAFPQVIEILERVEFITVRREGRKIVEFTESIPFHEELYDKLGQTWRADEPSDLEREMVALIDRLARSPLPAEELESELGLDRADIPRLVDVGKASSLIKDINLIDGQVLYSPFLGFEHPDAIAKMLETHGTGQLAEELEAVRKHQGLPLIQAKHPAISDAISRGFIIAPSVLRPDGQKQPFAAIPYQADRSLYLAKKTVLEKALAVVACIRCGEHFGGVTNTRNPVLVLNALLDPARDHRLGPHSSHKRQYQLLYRMQIVDFIPSGSWVSPKLIVTEDNLEAVRIARDLLTYGEPIDHRSNDEARALLSLASPYSPPLTTVHERRNRVVLPDKQYQAMMDAAMGRSLL